MLNISIVLYHPDWNRVRLLTDELLHARCVRKIYLIDNSETKSEEQQISSSKVKYIYPGKNLGYGRANNLAIRESIYYHTPYHLVINDDISMMAEDLDQLVEVMNSYPQIGQLMPRVTDADGEMQYLCKLLPTPWDVFARRFLPQAWNKRRNDRFELRMADYSRPMNVPYLSGCFMLLRTEAVSKARLFDERYFMYPEDIDLTRTIHRDYLTIYYPSITIIHDHRRASYHSWHMTWVHIQNMCRYFNKWGWLWDKERRLFNRETLYHVQSIAQINDIDQQQ